VSVTPENKNIIVWEKPSSTYITSYNVYRESTTQTGQWDLLGSIDYASITVFTDTSAEPQIQSNRYKISAIDSCGHETELSPEHKTMNLSILEGVNNSWTLIWDQYVGFTVSSYRIYRGTTADDLQFIGSTTAGNFNYNDFQAPQGDVFYQVEVISPNTCNPDGQKSFIEFSSSRSNIVSNMITAIPDRITEPGLRIYPNPSTDRIIISFPNADRQPYKILIYDVSGKIMYTETTSAGQVEIAGGNWVPGMYILEVKGPECYIDKIIISE